MNESYRPNDQPTELPVNIPTALLQDSVRKSKYRFRTIELRRVERQQSRR